MFTMLIGEVDNVPGTAGAQDHKISTRFFSLVGPLIPFQSMCVTYEHFESHGRSSTHSYSGEQVKLNLISVLLGYLRVWLAFAIFALPFVLYWGKSVESYMFIPSGYALVALIAVLVLPSLLTRTRRKKLTVLRRVAGLGCDPKLRYDFNRDETRDGLMVKLGESGMPTNAQVAMDRVTSMNQGELELTFAAAWYQRASGAKDWAPVMDAAWSKLSATAA
ncbi:MAG: hypothetical protein QM817_34670 [Archangium sp.]